MVYCWRALADADAQRLNLESLGHSRFGNCFLRKVSGVEVQTYTHVFVFQLAFRLQRIMFGRMQASKRLRT